MHAVPKALDLKGIHLASKRAVAVTWGLEDLLSMDVRILVCPCALFTLSRERVLQGTWDFCLNGLLAHCVI